MKEYTINNRNIAKYCVLCLSVLQKSHSCFVHSRVVSPSIENSVFLSSTFLAVVLRVETSPIVSMKLILLYRNLLSGPTNSSQIFCVNIYSGRKDVCRFAVDDP